MCVSPVVTFPLEMCDPKENKEESYQIVQGIMSTWLVLIFESLR